MRKLLLGFLLVFVSLSCASFEPSLLRLPALLHLLAADNVCLVQNMIFEVQDLVVASPATVSRCGMVYVEPQQMGWRPLRDSWMQAELPSALTQGQRDHVSRLIHRVSFKRKCAMCVVSIAQSLHLTQSQSHTITCHTTPTSFALKSMMR